MVKEVHGRGRARMGAAYQSLPTALTKPKPPGHREVETPTKHYQDPCSRCETHWQIRFGLPTLTTRWIWLSHHSIVLLPIITSRGVKYTHNDHKHSILDPDRGPTRIRLVPQEHTQEVIVVTAGGAKHRSMAPPTPPHNVADPHAVAKVHTVADPALPTPTTSSWAYGVIS